MSATMARQEGKVQLEQSDMYLAWNMAKMANGWFSCAAMKETQYLSKTPCTEAWEEKKLGVEFPGLKRVKAAIERLQAMLHQNHTAGCFPCHNGTAKNPQTCWGHKDTGAPTPDRCRQPTRELTPTQPEPSPTPCGNNSAAQRSQIVNLPARYVYSHTFLGWAEFFTLDAAVQDSQHNTDLDPDMLTDERTSTG